MKAAARRKRARTTPASPIDVIPCWGWGAKRARTTPASPIDIIPCWGWGAKRPRTHLPPSSRRGPVDDSTKLLHAAPPRPPHPHDDDDSNNNWRDWAGLDDGPAGLISECVLAYDVADYVRFRAVCRLWRQCCTDPRSHDGLDRRFHPRRWTMLREDPDLATSDRRFHPWRWTMLREDLAVPDRRCFLNTSTGQCIHVDIPELRDHDLLALTPEGLLVLVHDRKHICLLNPLTRQLIHLPPLTTLLPPNDHKRIPKDNTEFYREFKAWGSGIAKDDSTVVLCFGRLGKIGVAKPGDVHWTLLEYRSRSRGTGTPLMFAGRLYIFAIDDLMVLETSADRPPRLEVAAKMNMNVSLICRDSLHLVNNCGELLLVHGQLLDISSEWYRGYKAYRVNLDTRKLFRVKSLGGGAGRAVFLGRHSSLSVSLDVFPSGSITTDTVYSSPDMDNIRARAYHMADGSSEDTHSHRYRYRYKGSLVPRPYTLSECLSLSVTP